MSGPLRLGFLGAGFVAAEHVALLESVPAATITAVFDPDRGRSQEFAATTGAGMCGSADEVLGACDAVFVCSWTSEHHEAVLQAIDAKRAVFCEKPLATSAAGARVLATAAAGAAIVNQVGLVLRYSPAFHWLATLLADPRSGDVLSLSFRSDQYVPVQGAYASTWRADVARAGAGVLLEHSVHDMDIIDQLVGPVRSVTCKTQNGHGFPGIEDVASVLLGFDHGAHGTLTTVWHDILERPECRRVEIICERLWCCLDGNYHSGPVSWQWAGEEVRRLDGRALREAARAAGQATDNEDEAFVRAVLAGGPATPDFRAAVRAHDLLDAAYASATAGGLRTEPAREPTS